MVGTSISGVTFISVPGNVLNQNFYYMPLVLGFVVGYLVIAKILIPLYYRMNLTSIYGYLESRFGFFTYKTGASVFMVSRILGAAVRIFVVVLVLHTFLPQDSVPFWVVAFVFMFLIFLYTFKGGVKTIIWTDVLQTTFMLLAVGLTIFFVAREMQWSIGEMASAVAGSEYSKWLDFEWSNSTNAIKQFIAGIFITIVMTGLDQEMMQKNLSCRNIGDAKKNMITFSFIIVAANFIFLFLGAALQIYAGHKGIDLAHLPSSDDIFPTIAIRYLGPVAGLIFFIGLISAAFPSADGALTSLTTSFSIDFLNLEKKEHLSEKAKTNIRYLVHIAFAILMLGVIVGFRFFYDKALIDKLFTIAGYTYGPLLGLYSFGLFTKHSVKDKWVPLVAILSPIICYVLSDNSDAWFGYKFGFELLILNGLLTFAGLMILRKRK